MIDIKSTLNKLKKIQKQLDIQSVGNEPMYVIIRPNKDNIDNGFKWLVQECYNDSTRRSYFKELYVNDYETEYLQKNKYKKTSTLLFEF